MTASPAASIEVMARTASLLRALLDGLPGELLAVRDEEGWGRLGVQSVAGEITAANVLHHFANHDLLHLEQISALVRRPINEGRGAMRTLYQGITAPAAASRTVGNEGTPSGWRPAHRPLLGRGAQPPAPLELRSRALWRGWLLLPPATWVVWHRRPGCA